jgi:flagellar biosynthesis/type III secretory pathway protein FliH
MSDADSPRVTEVRPARVWQAQDLLQSSGKQAAFVAQAWPAASDRSFSIPPVVSLASADAHGTAESSPESENTDSAISTPAASPDGSATAAASPEHSAPAEQLNEEAVARIDAEAYARGVEEGRASMREELTTEVASMQAQDQATVQALESALAEHQRSPQHLFEPLKRLALHLAEQLVLAELKLEPKAIERLVQRCVDELNSSSELPVDVALNPADLARLQELRERTGMAAHEAWRLRPDDALMPGSVKISGNDAIVEDLIENRVSSLARSLLLDEVRWQAHTALTPERIMADRRADRTVVEDAQPRMTAAGAYAAATEIDDLLTEDE